VLLIIPHVPRKESDGSSTVYWKDRMGESMSTNQENPQPVKKSRAHRIYYALAAFDILTIAASVFLSHNILVIYKMSVMENRIWVDRSVRLDEIAQAAGAINAPGNDIFDSHDVKLESERIVSASAKFEKLMNEEASLTKTEDNQATQSELRNSYSKLATSVQTMQDEARVIFGLFQKGDTTSAGRRMATMDRRYAAVNSELSRLRGYFAISQTASLEREARSAADLAKFEGPFSAVILLIIILVSIYGHWIGKRTDAANEAIEAGRAQISASAKMASLGIMAAGIAHEINNPMAIISGRAEMLVRYAQKGKLTEAGIAETAAVIQKTCKRVAAIISGLRKFARDGEQDPIEAVSAKQIIEESLAFCNERIKNAGIALHIQDDCPDAMFAGRPVQVSQVMVNLLNNAVDAISTLPNPWIRIIVEENSDFLTFRFRDCGGGIPDAIAEKLLTPFFTTKEVGKGTGLGLSMSLGMVNRQGGKLYLNRAQAHTEFVMELPKSNGASLSTDSQKAA